MNCWRQITEQILAAHHISLVMTASSGDLRLLGGGRNSRVYSFTANSKKHVAKFYHTNPGDPRNRMMTELTALQFLHTIGFMDIPSPVAFGADRGLAVHEYIDGSPLDAASVSISDIDASVDFLKRLHKARLHPDAEAIGNASEACFAIQELAANIRARLDPLRKVSGNKPGLREFLEKELVPAFSRHMESLSDNMPAPAPRSNQTLSPSDFGFHNAIRRPDGSLCFCDFEYFGWDDPAKMISDFLLHPADRMQFELKLKKRFFDSIIEEFDPALPGRVEAIFPLYAIKWCIILLNEFLEDQFDRRAFATTAPLSRSDTEARQLEKARIMLKKNLKEFT
ncbi:MAG: hypothetical protein A2583_14215 [Bdellovibrionales bacterium RIFOXYD1_FULL_53_11]|nr:MAG: hypothetical protein A2583_14215 [Bdellovibrionales bacterium RIFOXYD1_FULL_53_11]